MLLSINQLVESKQEKKNLQQDATYCYEMQGLFCNYKIYLKNIKTVSVSEV